MKKRCALKTCNKMADFEITYDTGSNSDHQVLNICKSCFLHDAKEEFRMFIVEKKSI